MFMLVQAFTHLTCFNKLLVVIILRQKISKTHTKKRTGNCALLWKLRKKIDTIRARTGV